MNQVAEILKIINFEPIVQCFQQFSNSCAAFEHRLQELLEWVNYSCRKDKMVAHNKLIEEFKAKWTKTRQAAYQKGTGALKKLVNNINDSLQLFCQSCAIDTSMPQKFQYIFQMVEMEQRLQRVRPVLEELKQFQQHIATSSHEIATKHKIKTYENYFSPLQVSVECAEITSEFIMTGGWDGTISVYRNRAPEYQFVLNQPVSEFPIKSVKARERLLFIHDKHNTLHMRFLKHNQLIPYKNLAIGANYVFLGKRTLDRNFSIVTAFSQGIHILSPRYSQSENPTRLVVKHGLVRNDSVLCHFKNKILIYGSGTVLVFDNRTLSIEAELSISHDVLSMCVLDNKYLVSADRDNLYFQEPRLLDKTVKSLWKVRFDEEPRIALSPNSQTAYVVSSDKLFYISAPFKKLHQIDLPANKKEGEEESGSSQENTPNHVFQFSITGLAASESKLCLVGRDNKAQMAVINIECRARSQHMQTTDF